MLQSMTGFARSEGTTGPVRWVWELRSVNGKSLDLRLRLPQGYERLEPEVRRICSAVFSRGNIQVSLAAAGGTAAPEARLNERVLETVLAAAAELARRGDVQPPRVDGLLNIRGVLEFVEPEEDEAARAARDSDCLAGLEVAVAALKAARAAEGAALRIILEGHVATIANLVEMIEGDPARDARAIRERLDAQVALLLAGQQGLDPARLAMEAALLATKADVREELDRLKAHVAASRELLAGEGPVGRRLDFLAQEFNREANTICSKSNAASITAAGLDMKVTIDQFREQVQNLE
ncbi:MAG: YicC/YloC family endoribonuclease [Pararhizobium sp.]